jgi:hypothetical protein
MNQRINPTVFRIVGIAMIVLALINVVPSLALFGTGTPPPTGDNNAVGIEDESATEDAIEATGGITTITGTASYAVSILLVVIGIALLMLRRWEMFAALALILDALIKGANLLANLAVPEPNASLYLLPGVLMLVDLVLAWMIWQQRSARREGADVTVETRRTV